MNKQETILYIEQAMEDMGMFVRIHQESEHVASFIRNKYDRKRAHIALNPSRYDDNLFLAVALHELGHAKMYHKYSSREYFSLSTHTHELGAWNIALKHADSLGVKLEKEFIETCLGNYGVGKDTIEGMLSKWNNSLYSLSYA